MKIGDTVKYLPLGYKKKIECEVISIIPFGNFTTLDLKDKEFGTLFEGVLLQEELKERRGGINE